MDEVIILQYLSIKKITALKSNEVKVNMSFAEKVLQ